MSIRILEEAIANKIAAGEVIERPASVVKELVENAIDAGATEIEVVIEEAGRKLIQVTDNGSGMPGKDAVLSLQRHATSKITSSDDLFNIRTLGFRGEALPSIAAVSHLRMLTRPAGAEEGTELIAHGGTITDMRDIGCAPGTQIGIRQLFYNTPARLKFLKSDQTEAGQIVDFLNALTLCHHQLNIRLLLNGRETLSRPSSTRMLTHISAWLGRPAAEAMAPVELEIPGITIGGYVGKPEIARGNRSAQLFFVNGRRILNRTLTHALEYGCQGLLGAGRFPVAALKISVDPTQLDVNVHPAKAEVRFHRENEIHAAVVRAVKGALAGVNMVQDLAMHQANPSTFSAGGQGRRPAHEAMPSVTTQPLLTAVPEPSGVTSLTNFLASPGAPAPTVGLRPIGQFHGVYLVAEGRDALLVINQHRAHERILFEQLWSSFQHVLVQRLILPATLHLGYREAALLDEHLANLAGFGFEIEPMSGHGYLVRAVPAVLAAQSPEHTIQEILTDIETGISIAQFTCEDPTERALQEGRRRLLASIACKAAIKAGKILAPEEQHELLVKLQETKLSTVCPHGAPIIMTISQYELDRKFVR